MEGENKEEFEGKPFFNRLKDSCNSTRHGFLLLITLLIAVLMPWSNKLPNYGIVLLVVFFLFDVKFIAKVKRIPKRPLAIFGLLFFLLHLISYSIGSKNALNVQGLSVRLSFLILPLIYGVESGLNKFHKRLINSAFILSSLVVIIVLEVYAIYNFAASDYLNTDLLAYSLLAHPITHPGILSAYIFFGFVIASQQLLFKQNMTLWNKWFTLFYFLVSFLFLAQLASKIIFVVLLLYILWLAYYASSMNLSIVRTRSIRLFAILSIPMFLALVALFIKNRIVKLPEQITRIDKNVPLSNSPASRAVAWKVGFSSILDKPLFGHGVGEGNTVLIKNLRKQGFHRLADDGMHTHNEIIKVGIELGLLGIWLLLQFMFTAFRNLRRDNNYTYLWLLICMFLSCLTDDVLNLEAGAMFFLFFLSVGISWSSTKASDTVP